MLRPATPLSILLLAAFALLLLSVISTPIIKSIPLGTYEGYSFGVFGYCKGDVCSPFEIGYNTCKAANYHRASGPFVTDSRFSWTLYRYSNGYLRPSELNTDDIIYYPYRAPYRLPAHSNHVRDGHGCPCTLSFSLV